MWEEFFTILHYKRLLFCQARLSPLSGSLEQSCLHMCLCGGCTRVQVYVCMHLLSQDLLPHLELTDWLELCGSNCLVSNYQDYRHMPSHLVLT